MIQITQTYLIARLRELSSRIGIVLSLAPMMLDLTPLQNFGVVAVAIVLFGVPEDKFRK